MSGKGLEEKIRDIRIYADRLAVQASIASMERQKGMDEEQKDIAAMVVSSRRSQDHGFNTIANRFESMAQSLNQTESLRHDDRRLLESMAESLNQIFGHLKDNPTRLSSSTKYLEPNYSAEGPQDFQNRSPSPSSMLALEGNRQQLDTLLSRLNVDHQADVATSDTVKQLKLIHILSLESQDRAVALISSPQIYTWLTSTTSCAFHVNGQMFSSEYEARQSPLSYVCAKFVDSVLARARHHQNSISNPVVVLRWFCGQHTNISTNYDAHPPGMLNNLLSQLVHQLLSLGIESTPAHLSPLGHDPTLSDLCGLFMELTESLPIGTILFCILDGVSYYEDAQRRTELAEVLLMLTTLKRQCYEATKGPLIKILTTAPLRSLLAPEFFDNDEVLNMDESYPPNGGFTALQWDAGIGRKIDE